MRISDDETREILNAARQQFGADATVWLFGSRVDDLRRGGDIDLLVVVGHPVPDKSREAARFAAQLQWQLGDQKIDVVIDDGRTHHPIHDVAIKTGRQLRC
jgi:predicted nucleotidyltransferase